MASERSVRGETIFKKFTAFCYYRLLRSMSAYPIPLDTGDFRLIDKKVAEVFLNMREHNRFLRGMSAWMGYETVPVEYVRHERYAGKTKYTMKKMLKLAMDGITGFFKQAARYSRQGGRGGVHALRYGAYRADSACVHRGSAGMAVGC